MKYQEKQNDRTNNQMDDVCRNNVGYRQFLVINVFLRRNRMSIYITLSYGKDGQLAVLEQLGVEIVMEETDDSRNSN